MATLNQDNHSGVVRELGPRWVIITPRLSITPHPGAPAQFTIMEPLMWSWFSCFKKENCQKNQCWWKDRLERTHIVTDVNFENHSHKSTIRPCSWCTCCTIYSTSLFDLDMIDRHLKLKMPNTLSQGNAQLKTQVLLVDNKSKKKAN